MNVGKIFRNVVLALLLGVACYYFQEDLIQSGRNASKIAQDLWYKKELRISGNTALSRAALESMLPLSRSTLWWLSNQRAVQASLLTTSDIRTAEISRCQDKMWGCFQIYITENVPTYIALTKAHAWLLSGDGHFLTPLEHVTDEVKLVTYTSEFHARSGKRLVQLEGIVSEDLSPDIASSRMKYVTDALPVIESEVGKTVQRVEVLSSGEMKVKFFELPLVTTFGFSGGDLSELGLEARRLAMLLNRLKDSQREVGSVDLAFQKMAVVKMAGSPSGVPEVALKE